MPLTREQLEALKRPALQQLAKEHGIKANMKSVEIVDALLSAFGSAADAAGACEPEMAPASLAANPMPSSEQVELQENKKKEKKKEEEESVQLGAPSAVDECSTTAITSPVRNTPYTFNQFVARLSDRKTWDRPTEIVVATTKTTTTTTTMTTAAGAPSSARSDRTLQHPPTEEPLFCFDKTVVSPDGKERRKSALLVFSMKSPAKESAASVPATVVFKSPLKDLADEIQRRADQHLEKILSEKKGSSNNATIGAGAQAGNLPGKPLTAKFNRAHEKENSGSATILDKYQQKQETTKAAQQSNSRTNPRFMSPTAAHASRRMANLSAKPAISAAAPPRSTFDLSASLKRKLSYKPHGGPMKKEPLTERSNALHLARQERALAKRTGLQAADASASSSAAAASTAISHA